MKYIFSAASLLIYAFSTFAKEIPKEIAISSPDRRVSCVFSLEDGVPLAEVAFENKRVFTSHLGRVCEKGKVSDFKITSVNREWKPVWGFKEKYPENYTQLEVVLVRDQAKDSERSLQTLLLRCYNEGFAVRSKFMMEPYGLTAFSKERTDWRFEKGTAAWPIEWAESTFPADPIPLEKLSPEPAWRMPLTMRVANDCYASLFEAHAENYPRSFLQAEGGVLSPRFAVGVKEGRGEIFTPWRAVALASSPAELIERAYFVENLNPPCAIADTSWIKPGYCISDHGNFKLKTDDVISSAKYAKAIGVKYIQIDWGWYGTEYEWTDEDRASYLSRHPELKNEKTWIENTKANPYTTAFGVVPYHPYWPYSGHSHVELDIPAIVAEFRKHDIGLCLYIHGSILEKYDMDELFATYAKWGVVGLKPGFVAYGSQASTDFIRKLCATAAKHRLWLDIHDAYVPDGMERTWPNLMISEGGGGEEGNHPVRQDVALPFTRCLVGPFDYTPGLFYYRKARATKLHKAAMLLAYPGPTAIMRGSAKELVEKNASIVEFLSALPWNYDDTRVYDAEISRHLTVVRRKGQDYFIASLAGDEAHETSLPLSFLEENKKYKLTLWRDDEKCAGTPRGFVREERFVTKGGVLKIAMSASGGFCALVREEKE